MPPRRPADPPVRVAPGESAAVIGTTPIQGVIRARIEAAIDHTEGERQTWRMAAVKAFRGDPYGTEVPGRSDVVMTDVRDTIRAMLPSLLRVFFGGERAVEYAARMPEDVPFAAQATDVVNEIVLKQDNPGFLLFHHWMLDALKQRVGAVKLWWEAKESTRVRRIHAPLDGIAPDDAEAIEALDAIVLADAYPNRDRLPPYRREDEHLIVTETRDASCLKFDVLPPESFFYSPDARSPDHVTCIGDKSDKTIAELRAMGVPEAVLERYSGATSESILDEEEERTRAPESSPWEPTGVSGALATVQYVEAYMLLDVTKDADERTGGDVTWRRVCCIGPGLEVIVNEPADDHPYAILTPYPEPHKLEGMCPVDDTLAIQRSKTHIMRATLDSLAEAVIPRKVVLEDQVEMQDVITNKLSHPIRERVPGAVRLLEVPFVGDKTLAMLGYFDTVKQSRTGVSDATTGLAADALQSTTPTAIAAATEAGRQRLEMIARIFAETGIRSFFKKALRMLVEHQTAPRVIRLRNEFVTVEPGQWDADMDVTIKVGLGTGLVETRLAALGQIAQKQEQVYQVLGPGNPLVGLVEYRNTLAEMATLAGFTDPSRFFKPVTPEVDLPPPPPPPQPDPAMILAEVEREKTQADIAIKQMETEARIAIEREKLLLEREKIALADDRERDQQEADVVLRGKELLAKYGVQVRQQDMDAEMAAVQMAQSAPRATDDQTFG